VFGLDTLIDADEPREFPAPDALSVTIAGLHFPLMALVVWGLSQNDLSPLPRLGRVLPARLRR